VSNTTAQGSARQHCCQQLSTPCGYRTTQWDLRDCSGGHRLATDASTGHWTEAREGMITI
jgi:hypothetical protein